MVKLFALKQHKYTNIILLKYRLHIPQFSGSNCEQFEFLRVYLCIRKIWLITDKSLRSDQSPLYKSLRHEFLDFISLLSGFPDISPG